MKLNSVCVFTFNLIACNFHIMCTGNYLKTLGKFEDCITMRHPYLAVIAYTLHQITITVNIGKVCTTIFPDFGRCNFSPILLRHQLCTVAHAKGRNNLPDSIQIRIGNILPPDGKRTSGKNYTLDITINPGDLIERMYFTINIQFPYTPVD